VPPANDNFSAAIDLGGNAADFLIPAVTEILGATTESGEPRGSAVPQLFQTVWFKWTCPTTDSYEFDTGGSPNHDNPALFLDTTMAIWTGTALNNLVEVASNNDAGGSYGETSICTFDATAGTVYWIQVGTGTSNASGEVDLNWAPYTPPPPSTANYSLAFTPTAVDISAPNISHPVSLALNVVSPPGNVTLTFSSSALPSNIVLTQTPTVNGTYDNDTSFALTLTADALTPAGTYIVDVTGDDGTDILVSALTITISYTGDTDSSGNPFPRLRTALWDISCATFSQANGGLRHFTGGDGHTHTSGDAGGPGQCGVVEHQGDAVFWWMESWDDGVATNMHKEIGVARIHQGLVEFLGTPFYLGRDDIDYGLVPGSSPPVIDIAWDTKLVSDGTHLYCVTGAMVNEGSVGGWVKNTNYSGEVDGVKTWRLACLRWEGGTTWSDWGWDAPRAFNSGAYYPAHDAVVGPNDTEVWSAASAPGFAQPGVAGGGLDTFSINYAAPPLGYSQWGAFWRNGACSSSAEAGVVHAQWVEGGCPVTDPVQTLYSTELTAVAHQIDHYQGYLQTREYLHTCRFTGPGQLDSAHRTTLWDFVVTEWDGDQHIGAPFFSTPLPSYFAFQRRRILHAVMVNQDVPLLSLAWDELRQKADDPYNFDTPQPRRYAIIDPTSGSVINGNLPGVAWGFVPPSPGIPPPAGGTLIGTPGIYTNTDPTASGISLAEWVANGYRWVSYQGYNGGTEPAIDLSAAKNAGFDPNFGVGIWGVTYGNSNTPDATVFYNDGHRIGEIAVAKGAQHVIIDAEFCLEGTGPTFGAQPIIDGLRAGGWSGPVHLSTFGATSNPNAFTFNMDVKSFLDTGGGVLPQAYSNETPNYDAVNCQTYWTRSGRSPTPTGDVAVGYDNLNYTIGLYTGALGRLSGADYVTLLQAANVTTNFSIFLGETTNGSDKASLDELSLTTTVPETGYGQGSGNAPHHLAWDSVSQKYWHCNTQGLFSTEAAGSTATEAVVRVVSLSPDGKTWDKLTRNSVDVHRAGWFNMPQNTNQFPTNTFYAFGDFPMFIGMDPGAIGNVYLWGAATEYGHSAMNQAVYAWNPCPAPGPLDEHAWFWLPIGNLSDFWGLPPSPNPSAETMDPGFRMDADKNFVPPIADASSYSYAGSTPIPIAVKIGSFVYVIMAEHPHAYSSLTWDPDHSDFRIWKFEIRADIDSASCPALIDGTPTNPPPGTAPDDFLLEITTRTRGRQ
jgi:hypothetical protein